jgi:hypothetical protein
MENRRKGRNGGERGVQNGQGEIMRRIIMRRTKKDVTE